MRTCVEDLMELEAQRKDKVRQEEEEVTEEPKRFTTQEMARGFSFFFHKFIYFIYLFLAVLGLCCCARAFSSCGERGYPSLWYVGFSLRWLLLLQSTGSRHVGFSSCGTRAQELWLTGSRAQAQ